MSALYDFAAVFVHSDVSGPSPDWWHWINAQSSHVLLGAMVGAITPRLWFPLIVGFFAKELIGDIPDGDWSGLIMLDSAADLVSACLGYRLLGLAYPPRTFLKRS